MPYTFKGKKACTKSDGSKGGYYTKKKGKSGRCYDSESAYKKSMQAGYAGKNEADELGDETMTEIRRGIRQIILEVCHNCPLKDMEEMVVEPVYDMIVGSYPQQHTDDDGRMFDYGHTKSDSHEGRMTRAKLYRMGKMAQSFHDRLEDGDDLPQWVNDKVTTAEDRLRSAFEYMDYKLHRNKMQGKMCNESMIRSMARNYLRSVL
tara:strand:+ start:176 stop:790 length:615 start_codon:yes stop_codon:yes gene_type:complete